MNFKASSNFLMAPQGNETAARAPDTPSLATAAARQREADLIMEALVREYLNGTSSRN
jgi:hypothetical protein